MTNAVAGPGKVIDLYGLSSPNVMKVVILLEEAGLPFRLLPIDIWAGDQFSDDFKALNPNSKAPVIVDPDGPDGAPFTVFESGAILVYLAEKVGRFIPAGPAARYAMLQWLMLQMASIGPMYGQATHFRRSGPPGSEYSLARYTTEARRLADVLEVRLSQAAYLAGDDYSIADMATYPWIALYHEPNGIDLNTLPALKRWSEAIAARPAVAHVHSLWAEWAQNDQTRRGKASSDGFDRLFGRGKYARVD